MATRESRPAAPVPLSDNARLVLERRYLAKDEMGGATETPERLFRRVAHNIAQAELLYKSQNVDNAPPELWENRFLGLMAISAPVRTNGKTEAKQAIRAFAVRFRQKRPDVNLYVTALSVKDLLGRFESDTYRSDNPAGYQRAVGASRVRSLSAYMRSEEGMLPTSILLCIRQPGRGEFEAVGGGGSKPGAGETGLLTIGPEVPLWVVDGQHRLAGLERA